MPNQRERDSQVDHRWRFRIATGEPPTSLMETIAYVKDRFPRLHERFIITAVQRLGITDVCRKADHALATPDPVKTFLYSIGAPQAAQESGYDEDLDKLMRRPPRPSD